MKHCGRFKVVFLHSFNLHNYFDTLSVEMRTQSVSYIINKIYIKVQKGGIVKLILPGNMKIKSTIKSTTQSMKNALADQSSAKCFSVL